MNKSPIDLQHVKVLAAFGFGVARPHSSQKSFHLQARRGFAAAIERLPRTVGELKKERNVNEVDKGGRIKLFTYLGCCLEACLYQ
jgi:hypothetical protein